MRIYNSIDGHEPFSPNQNYPGLEPSSLGLGFTESFNHDSIKVPGGFRINTPRARQHFDLFFAGQHFDKKVLGGILIL